MFNLKMESVTGIHHERYMYVIMNHQCMVMNHVKKVTRISICESYAELVYCKCSVFALISSANET